MTYTIENHYFGCFNYYSDLYKYSYIKIYQYLPWYKMGFLNRCIIAGANGAINLTVPVKGGRNQKSLFNEVLIDNSINWQKQHLRAIMSSYAKSPYYEYYIYWVNEIYNKKFEYLKDLNTEVFLLVLDKLKLNISIINLNDNLNEDSQNSANNYRKWLPNNYSTQNDNFKYLQVFENKIGFLPNISILDAIFNLGPQLNFSLKQHSINISNHINNI